MVIEYDGEQHFRPVRFHKNITGERAKELFEHLLRYDAVKDTYCEVNQIRMLRIRYDELGQAEEIIRKNIGCGHISRL